jgi:hypothetical protein
MGFLFWHTFFVSGCSGAFDSRSISAFRNWLLPFSLTFLKRTAMLCWSVRIALQLLGNIFEGEKFCKIPRFVVPPSKTAFEFRKHPRGLI